MLAKTSVASIPRRRQESKRFRAPSCGGWRSAVPHHAHFSTGLQQYTAAGFPKGERSKRRRPRWKPRPFYNPASEVTSHHFCHILLIDSPSRTQKEEITQGHTGQEGVITGATPGAMHHPGLSQRVCERVHFCHDPSTSLFPAVC